VIGDNIQMDVLRSEDVRPSLRIVFKGTNGDVKISTLHLIIFNTAQILEFATFFLYEILKCL